MKWLRRITWRIAKRAWEDHDEFEAEQNRYVLKRGGGGSGRPIRQNLFNDGSVPTELDSPRANSMNFKLYTCVGGHILETSKYDQRKDENQHTLYMIHEDKDFAQQVAQSIMLEMMKQ